MSINIKSNNVNTIRIYSFTLDEEFSFAGFLTDFSDGFTSNWNSQEIYGRMDPIFTYKSTTRKISLAFDVPSISILGSIETGIVSQKLIKSLYPVYEDQEGRGTATIASPPLVRIKLANLICRSDKDRKIENAQEAGLLGWIDGFTFKPELESGVFINDDNTVIYPKLYKVSFGFNIIHEHALGHKVSGGKHIPRITINNNPSQAFPNNFVGNLPSQTEPEESSRLPVPSPPPAPPPPIAPPASQPPANAVQAATSGTPVVASGGDSTLQVDRTTSANGDSRTTDTVIRVNLPGLLGTFRETRRTTRSRRGA